MARSERLYYEAMALDLQRDYENGTISEEEYFEALDAMAQAITGME